MKFRYVALGLVTCVVVSLSSCNNGTSTVETKLGGDSATPVSQASANHGGHGGKKVNINSAILSELDRFEGMLGVPALSNKIQANRPYASPEELVTKKVISQAQFDQIKEMVTIEDVVLTGEAKDVDYMTKLGLMKGHLYVAQELLNQNQAKKAEPHIGHPVEEIYVDVEQQLSDRQVKEFKTQLVSLQDLVKADRKPEQIKTDLKASIQSVDTAIAALSDSQRRSPRFVLQTINGLLDAANSEYGAAIANNKIAAEIEYQDSRGFVIYANELYEGIAAQISKENPTTHKTIEANLTQLLKVWPSVIPPSTPVQTPEQVAVLIKEIEKSSQVVINKVSTPT